MSSYYDGVKPILIAVDCIVFGFEHGKLKILIGQRKMNPGLGQQSLYGGFVGVDESLDEAAKRTLKELTGLENQYLQQVGAYGEIDRDPGMRVISVAYCSLINVSDYDESLCREYKVRWIDFEDIPSLYSDHKTMVDNAIAKLRRDVSSEPLCFNLLPELFTLTQLQMVYEAILGETIDKRNFRKRIKAMPYIKMTEKIDKLTSKRGAALYRFDEQVYHQTSSFKL